MSNTARESFDWIPQPKPETFGSRLKMVREEHDWTIDEIVALCNLGLDVAYFNKATWSTWENGAKPRDMAKAVELIHNATHIHRGWLLWGSTSMRKATRHLVGLPSDRDNRYASPTNQPPILRPVPPLSES